MLFCFIIWNISCHSLLDWSVSVDKSAASLFRASLYFPCFSLADFKILSLSLILGILIMICLGVGSLVHLDWDFLCFLNLHGFFSLSWFRKFSVIIFSKRVSIPCSFSSSSGIPMIQMFLCFMLFWSSLKLSSYFFSLYSCSCCAWVFLSTLFTSSLIWFCASPSQLVIPFSVFFYFIYCILHFFLAFVFSFYFLFHAIVVPTQLLLVVTEFLEHPNNHSFEFCVS